MEKPTNIDKINKEIDLYDVITMLAFIDYIRLSNQKNKQETSEPVTKAKKLIKDMALKPNLNNQQIIKSFEKILNHSDLFKKINKINAYYQKNIIHDIDVTEEILLKIEKKEKTGNKRLSHLDWLNLLIQKLQLG